MQNLRRLTEVDLKMEGIASSFNFVYTYIFFCKNPVISDVRNDLKLSFLSKFGRCESPNYVC